MKDAAAQSAVKQRQQRTQHLVCTYLMQSSEPFPPIDARSLKLLLSVCVGRYITYAHMPTHFCHWSGLQRDFLKCEILGALDYTGPALYAVGELSNRCWFDPHSRQLWLSGVTAGAGRLLTPSELA